jgi:transcriptional regulator GlxA family with amidase domain
MSDRQLPKIPPAQRVAELIEASLENPPSLRTLAVEVSLTPFQLSRVFHRYHGETIPGYVRRLRMGRAASMLAKSNMMIGQIALAVGYHSLGAFVRGFTRELGKTPSAYRKGARSTTPTATPTKEASGGLCGLVAAWVHELFWPAAELMKFSC